jgi:hypothetical protein
MAPTANAEGRIETPSLDDWRKTPCSRLSSVRPDGRHCQGRSTQGRVGSAAGVIGGPLLFDELCRLFLLRSHLSAIVPTMINDLAPLRPADSEDLANSSTSRSACFGGGD